MLPPTPKRKSARPAAAKVGSVHRLASSSLREVKVALKPAVWANISPILAAIVVSPARST